MADRCFGHRLMMDRIVPGGVERDLSRRRRASICIRSSPQIRRRFPELVELYDNTASLQDRTVGTGILSPALARQFGCGGYVGRASGRGFDARRIARLSAVRCAAVRGAGARRRRRGRPHLDPHPRGRAERGVDRSDPRAALRRGRSLIRSARCRCGQAREGMALVEGFRGDVLVWVQDRRRRQHRALPPARPVVVPVAACSRPRSRATSSPTSPCATSRSTARTRAMICRASAHA